MRVCGIIQNHTKFFCMIIDKAFIVEPSQETTWKMRTDGTLHLKMYSFLT